MVDIPRRVLLTPAWPWRMVGVVLEGGGVSSQDVIKLGLGTYLSGQNRGPCLVEHPARKVDLLAKAMG